MNEPAQWIKDLITKVTDILKGGTRPGSFIDVAQNVFNWFVFLAGFLTILVIIYAGIMYITAAGEEEKQAGAKKTLQYAIIGFIVLSLAYLIVRVLINVL